MPQIKVQADFGEVSQASQQMTQSLDSVANRFGTVTSEIQRFNSAGVLVSSVMKGLTKDGREFAATMGLVGRQIELAERGLDPGKLNALSISYKKTSEAVDELTTKQGSLAAVGERMARAFQYFVAYKAFNAITDQIRDGTRAANEFQIQLSLIRTLSQDNQMSFSKWGKEVRSVSDASGFDLNETGKAFYDAISNQTARGSQTTPFVRGAADLARVTGSSLTDSVNLLSSALNSYGLAAKDAERVSAVFFRTIDEGRVVASELANVFGRVGVIGANIGVSMEDLNATLAITTQKGFKTTDAMTLLTNLMIKLEKPTQATAGFFRELGVSTGEEAIQLYGYTGVLRKMVELTRSGKVDVSAFFDEIRGRKQFGIFEQSIDEIEAFSNKLKNTSETMKLYQNAVEIRGESPADFFNKEWNAFTNIFKEDLGQRLISIPKGISDSFNSLMQNDMFKKALPSLKAGAVAAAGGLTIMGTSALFAATSTTTLGRAALFLGKSVPVLVAATAGFIALREAYYAFSNVPDFGKIDTSEIDNAINKYKELQRMRTLTVGPAATDKEIIGARSAEGFKGIAAILAQAQIKNDEVLNAAVAKSKTLGEALKLGFQGYSDTLKNKLSETKKAITDSRNEIEKSKKSLLSFKDSLDSIVFNRKIGYATDEQKVALGEEQIKKLTERATKLLSSGDSASRDEGRKLFDEIARAIDQNEDVKQQIQKQFAQDNAPAGETTTFFFSTEGLATRLKALYELRDSLENKSQANEKRGMAVREEDAKKQALQLRTFQDALKDFENLNLTDKSGKVNKEYTTKGQFDPAKYIAAGTKIEDVLRANFEGTYAEKQQFELKLAEFAKAKIAEVNAFERQEYIKTTQAKLNADQEAFKAKLNKTQTDRDEAIRKEQEIQANLVGQASVLKQLGKDRAGEMAGRFGIVSEEDEKLLKSYNESVARYELSVGKLKANRTEDGFRPGDIERVGAALKEATDKARGLATKLGYPDPNVGADGADGKRIGPTNLDALTEDQLQKLRDLRGIVQSTRETEKALWEETKKSIEQPLNELKLQFPDIAKAADDALKAVQKSAVDAANDGIAPLIMKLKELQGAFDDLQKGVAPKVREDIGSFIGGEPAYAASGGIAGMFPGQPRGADVYPIWAARGERIIDARTSEAYRPMLDAIVQRRMPQYFSSGGTVGGSTTIGDININVTGGQTNEQTARVIGNRLERQLRMGNVNLPRKT